MWTNIEIGEVRVADWRERKKVKEPCTVCSAQSVQFERFSVLVLNLCDFDFRFWIYRITYISHIHAQCSQSHTCTLTPTITFKIYYEWVCLSQRYHTLPSAQNTKGWRLPHLNAKVPFAFLCLCVRHCTVYTYDKLVDVDECDSSIRSLFSIRLSNANHIGLWFCHTQWECMYFYFANVKSFEHSIESKVSIVLYQREWVWWLAWKNWWTSKTCYLLLWSNQSSSLGAHTHTPAHTFICRTQFRFFFLGLFILFYFFHTNIYLVCLLLVVWHKLCAWRKHFWEKLKQIELIDFIFRI